MGASEAAQGAAAIRAAAGSATRTPRVPAGWRRARKAGETHTQKLNRYDGLACQGARTQGA